LRAAKGLVVLGAFVALVAACLSPALARQQPDDPFALDTKQPLPADPKAKAAREKFLIPDRKSAAVFVGRRDPKTGKIDGGIEDYKPTASEKENSDEYQAWNAVVSHALQFPDAALMGVARRDFTRDDFLNPPRFDARLDLFRLEGKLTKVRRIAATKSLAAANVPEVYEAQIVPLDEPPNALVSFVFTDLPADLEGLKKLPIDKNGGSAWMDVNSWAAFAGFFFKVRQDVAGGTPIPLFIGRSVTVLKAEPRPEKNPTALEKGLRVFDNIRDDAAIAKAEDNWEEVSAWNRVLLHARRFLPEELENAASDKVTFADLRLDVRRDFRLDLVKFEGRLVKLDKMKASEKLRAAGVESLYEGWLVPKNEPSGHPVCIIFSDPPEVEPAGRVNKWVSFAGYSFKLLRYKSAERDKDDPDRQVTKVAPLLIGRALVVRPDPDAPTAGRWSTPMDGALAVVLGLFVVAGLITLWYRRGDSKAKQEIDAHRTRNPFGEAGTA
jgi:hypothetical protein